jgi:hypothetical protein
VVRGEIHQQDLLLLCAERLPKYILPEEIELFGMLPKTAVNR